MYVPSNRRAGLSYYGLGISTAEVYAKRYGIPLPAPGRGVGAVTTQNISQIAATGASTTVGLLVALGAVSGPIGAAIGGLIAVGSLLVSIFKGCGQTCVQATAIANQVEQALQQNLSQYMASPVRTVSMQQAALNNFATAWAALVANCSNPQLGTAGQNCVSQRQQGACAYKVSAGGWQGKTFVPYGANGSGSTCWNWFVGYHDPIANDPNVQPDTAAQAVADTVSAGASSLLSAVGVNPNTTLFGLPLSELALPAGLLILAAVLFGGD